MNQYRSRNTTKLKKLDTQMLKIVPVPEFENFPKEGLDAFDKSTDSGDFFVFSRTHSNLASSLNAFDDDTLGMHIPKGYTSIYVCKRIMLFSNGNSVGDWTQESRYKEFATSRGIEFLLIANGTYKLFVNSWNQFIDTQEIYKDTSGDVPWISSWVDLDECIAAARDFSGTNSCLTLISLIIENKYWH